MAVVLAFVLAAPAHGQTPKVRSLQRQVAALKAQRTQLYGTIGQLQSQLSAQANADSIALGSAQTQLEQTQQALAQVTQERDSYKAQIAAVPTEIQRGESEVRDELAYLHFIGRPEPDGYLISRLAMDYVVGHVSAMEYGYRHEVMGETLPASAEQALEMQAGICGNAAWAFAEMVKSFGFDVRSVQFFYAAGTHIAVEVFYAEGWHYFDPTWGAFYSAAASITDARADQLTPERDTTQAWAEFAPGSLADLSVLTDPSTEVELDQQPL